MSINNSSTALSTFSPVSESLTQVRKLISKHLSTPDGAPEIGKLLSHIDNSSGKMIRPGLVLLTGASCGDINDQHITVAAVVEMIHTATLLHDDIIDEGKTRRGLPTINSKWGNESAVLLGDFLLSRVFRICADLPRETAREIAGSAMKVCEGELRQVAHKHDHKLTESEYIDIIANKSASLFSSCCYMGANLAQADSKCADSMRDFGLNTGIAFQITDDLLDVVGDESRTGKTTGSDVNNSKLTLPLIHLLNNVNGQKKKQVESMLEAGLKPTGELRELLSQYGSFEYTRNKSRQFIEKAITSLNVLEDSDAKNALMNLAHFVGDRIS